MRFGGASCAALLPGGSVPPATASSALARGGCSTLSTELAHRDQTSFMLMLALLMLALISMMS